MNTDEIWVVADMDGVPANHRLGFTCFTAKRHADNVMASINYCGRQDRLQLITLADALKTLDRITMYGNVELAKTQGAATCATT